MAIHSSDRVNYFLSLPLQHKDFLGEIRHWGNLKIGFEDDLIWIKDLNLVQIDSVEVKSIPYKEIYYASGDKLFLKGSLLPSRRIPSLLWSPIHRGLSLELPRSNHNYFRVASKANVRIVTSAVEKESYGLLVAIDELQKFIETAPSIRLKNLRWVIVDNKALILGNPLLPLNGDVFWKRDNFLLPSGFDLELPILTSTIAELINKEQDHWIVWNKEGSYYAIDKRLFSPLSISSFRLTITN